MSHDAGTAAELLYGSSARKHGSDQEMEVTHLDDGAIEYRRRGALYQVMLPAHTRYLMPAFVVPGGDIVRSEEYPLILHMSSPDHELLHRVAGPAIEAAEGTHEEWWINGHRSRPGGGPTVTHPDGSKRWVHDDKAYFTEDAWLAARQGLIP